MKRFSFWILALCVALGAYFLAPLRTNILLMGIDRPPEGTDASRTDTLILTTIMPLRPYVGMLSIPRDLWVKIPGVGENRINTAHFFAEANQHGSGPAAAAATVSGDFGVPVDYTVRIRFDGITSIVDAMGGVDVELPKATAILPAGKHHLDGKQALAFVRDRKNADDFFRMEDGQLFIKAMFRQMFSPATWLRLPKVAAAVLQSVDTNVPAWLWPRLLMAILRAGPKGIDGRTLTREMVTPFTTSGGAQVLLPQWDQINPVVDEIFRERS
jgi:LCP family protein required for cell wall assembly